MSKKDGKRGVDRGASEALRVGKLLSELYGTADSGLAAFHAKRCPQDGDVASVGRLRDLLDVVGEAVESADPGLWRKIDAAWRLVTADLSEVRARAALEKAEAEAQASGQAKGKRDVRAASAARDVSRADASGGPAPAPERPTPPKPPSVFAQAAPLSDDEEGPMPARAPSPWVRPSVAGRSEAGSTPAGAAVAPSVEAPPVASSVPAAACAPAPVTAAPLPLVPVGCDETGALDAKLLGLEALPFSGSVVAPPSSAAVDLPPVAERDLDQTSVGRVGLSVDQTMPFVGARSLRKKLAEEVALAGRQAVEPPPPPAARSGTPLFLQAPTEFLAPMGDASDQVRKGSDVAQAMPPVVELTLEQYAALVARCDADKIDAAAIERSFGVLGPEARRALDAHWAARFQVDRALYRDFQARFLAYRSWLDKERGGGAAR